MLAESTIKIIGKPFIQLNSVDSTNNYAMQQIKKRVAKHGTAYFAHEQTNGKGQRNKQWLSTKGENIILTVVLKPKVLSITEKFYLNIIAALAVKDLFNKYATEIFKIKWTNDIYFGDRKAAGILIENIVSGKIITNSVIGFGLNINQTLFDSSLKNPVSLKQITNKTYDVIKLAEELCLIFQSKYFLFADNDFQTLINEYNQYLYKKDCMVNFKKDDALFEGKVIVVDSTGKIIIKTSDKELAFEFGSIEWIIE